MKYAILSLMFLMGLNMEAQTKKEKKAVPSEVMDSFKKAFPTAKASWEIEKNGDYEGAFTLKGKEASATFDKTGHLKELEVEIESSTLPKAATDYIKKHHSGQKMIETAKITDDKGVITYEIEIEIKGKPTDLLFDTKGNLIKKI